jgi:phosphoribosyl-ATP pyrophosphohydrolase/phosphoribosyl-AMP cyclohydrolase
MRQEPAGTGTGTLDLDTLDFAKGAGLVTVVTQDAASGTVLMVAHADREAMERTLATGEMHYRSRTRGLWRKGETSGNLQRVVSLHADCDRDVVLARVEAAGPACHTGAVSCFGDPAVRLDALDRVGEVIAQRAATMPSGTPAGDPPPTAGGGRPSYTQRLLADRNLRLKKIGEEAAELVTACADGDRTRAIEETADLVFHALVALRACGAGIADVRSALSARRTAAESATGTDRWASTSDQAFSPRAR